MNRIDQFINAVKAGRTDEVEHMLSENADLAMSMDENGVSVVLTALYFGEVELARTLAQVKQRLNIWEASALGDITAMEQGSELDPAVINAVSPDGFQPIGLAAFFNQSDAVEYLITHGAEVNTASNNSMKVTPLHSAVAGGQMRIVDLLLEAGAQVNAVQQDGFTALHAAASIGQLEMVQLLMCYGADASAQLKDGRLPIQLAEENHHEAVINLLSQS